MAEESLQVEMPMRGGGGKSGTTFSDDVGGRARPSTSGGRIRTRGFVAVDRSHLQTERREARRSGDLMTPRAATRSPSPARGGLVGLPNMSQMHRPSRDRSVSARF